MRSLIVRLIYNNYLNQVYAIKSCKHFNISFRNERIKQFFLFWYCCKHKNMHLSMQFILNFYRPFWIENII